jgi:hypothetical protein
MTNEMAQELTNLPCFNAYAKVIEEKDGKQIVLKRKIQTIPLSFVPEKTPADIEANTLMQGNVRVTAFDMIALFEGYCQARKDIEEEIKQRLEKWRNGRSDEPPPTFY